MNRAIKQALQETEKGRALLAANEAAKRARASRVKAKPRAPGKPTRGERRITHREETVILRDVVWARACGRCEVSGVELGTAWHLHHVKGGGHRRPRQRLGNVLAVSWDVHRLIHRGDLETLRQVLAAAPLDAEARRAAEHRLNKVLEAQGTPMRLEVA